MKTRPYFLIAIVSLLYGCSTMTPLTKAAKDGDITTINTLISSGSNVNEPSKGKSSATPLFWALHSKSNDMQILDVIKLLVESGADLNARDESGYTPLHWAVIYRKVDIVKYLISKGASDGQKALEIAKAYDYPDIIKLFTMSKPITIGIITDVCILRDTMVDDKYFSLGDSMNAQESMSLATQKIVEQKGFDASIQDMPFICSFKDENLKLRVAQYEDTPVTLQSPPFLTNKTISLNEQYQQMLINLIKYTAKSVKPKEKPKSKIFQWINKLDGKTETMPPVSIVDENTKKSLNEFAKQKNVDRVLILIGNGIIVPETKSITQGIALGAITRALTLGMFTFSMWNVSALQTVGMLIDVQTGEILWSNSFVIKSGGFTGYDYYAAGEWYNSYLYELPN